jgi:mannan endo-1,4-beta-mannosidase
MNPRAFLDSACNLGLSVTAWVRKYDVTDADALLTAGGTPNNNGNNNRGSGFKNYCARVRRP